MKTCSECNKQLQKNLICTRCRQSYYCNVECQKKHWPEHKLGCTEVSDTPSTGVDVECFSCLKTKPAFSLCKRCGTSLFCSEECSKKHDELLCDRVINQKIAESAKSTEFQISVIGREKVLENIKSIYTRFHEYNYNAIRYYGWSLGNLKNNKSAEAKLLHDEALPMFERDPASRQYSIQEKINVYKFVLEHHFSKKEKKSKTKEYRKLLEIKQNLEYYAETAQDDTEVFREKLRESFQHSGMSADKSAVFEDCYLDLLLAVGALTWMPKTLEEYVVSMSKHCIPDYLQSCRSNMKLFTEAKSKDLKHWTDLFSPRYALVIPKFQDVLEAFRTMNGSDQFRNIPLKYRKPKFIAWREFHVVMNDPMIEQTSQLEEYHLEDVDQQYREHDMLFVKFLQRRTTEFDQCFGGLSPRKRQQREIYTKEYIAEMVEHLTNTASEIYQADSSKTVVRVHVLGAADGRLCYALQKKLIQLSENLTRESECHWDAVEAENDKDFYEPVRFAVEADSETRRVLKSFQVEITASDESPCGWTKESGGERALYACKKVASVKQALDVFKPDIVLCNWMPSGVDWTAELRLPSRRIVEYLLIGCPDFEICGKAWESWGEKMPSYPDKLHPAEINGYQKKYLVSLSKYQICCVDNPSAALWHRSRTVSFRKIDSDDAYVVLDEK